jgi:hypothetical protein
MDAEDKLILSETAGALAAISVITYDISGYSSVREAEFLVDILNDRVNKNLKILKEDISKTYLGAT